MHSSVYLQFNTDMESIGYTLRIIQQTKEQVRVQVYNIFYKSTVPTDSFWHRIQPEH